MIQCVFMLPGNSLANSLARPNFRTQPGHGAAHSHLLVCWRGLFIRLSEESLSRAMAQSLSLTWPRLDVRAGASEQHTRAVPPASHRSTAPNRPCAPHPRPPTRETTARPTSLAHTPLNISFSPLTRPRSSMCNRRACRHRMRGHHILGDTTRAPGFASARCASALLTTTPTSCRQARAVGLAGLSRSHFSFCRI